MRIKRNYARVILALLIFAAFLPLFPATAVAEASGYWQLADMIETVDPDTEGHNAGAGNKSFGKHSALSHGEFYQVQTASWECSDCHIVHSNECRVTATIPPGSFLPGEIISLHVTLDGKLADMQCHYGHDRIDAEFSAQFLVGGSSVSFLDEAGKGCWTDVENGVAHMEKTLTATAPEAEHYGLNVEEIEILMNYCSEGSTRLIYTWVADAAPPADSGTEQSKGNDTTPPANNVTEQTEGDDTSGFEEEGAGLSPLAVAAGVVILGGGTVVIIRLVRKKPDLPRSAKNNEPEVTDRRGNRTDENARVQQTHQEYAQTNRDAQATAQQANPSAQPQAPAQTPQPDIPIGAADFLGGPGDNPYTSFEDVTTCKLS